MDKDTYIRKWVEGSLTEEERNNFERTEDFKSLAKIDSAMSNFSAPPFDVVAEYEKINRARNRQIIRFTSLGPILKLAAVLILAVGAYFYFTSDSIKRVETLAAQKTELWLPDSSFVALNSQSQITFDENNWKLARKVNLEGEGYFKVTKGAQFDIITSAGTVTVVGTAFNVKSRNALFEVTCFEGLVKVIYNDQETMLPANTVFRAINATTSNNISTEVLPGWMRDESTFKSVPFSHVIEEFERQYDHQVEVRGVDTDQLFSGTFTNSNMDLALKTISIPINLTYQILDNKKIILSSDKN